MITQVEEKLHSVLPFFLPVCDFQETPAGDCGSWSLRVFGKEE